MSRFAWRIALDTPNYSADDLAGTGTKVTGGRWNRPGTALPLNRYLVRIEILDATWNAAVVLSAASRSAGMLYPLAR